MAQGGSRGGIYQKASSIATILVLMGSSSHQIRKLRPVFLRGLYSLERSLLLSNWVVLLVVFARCPSRERLLSIEAASTGQSGELLCLRWSITLFWQGRLVGIRGEVGAGLIYEANVWAVRPLVLSIHVIALCPVRQRSTISSRRLRSLPTDLQSLCNVLELLASGSQRLYYSFGLFFLVLHQSLEMLN